MSNLTDVRWRTLTPLCLAEVLAPSGCKRGAGGICIYFVSAENFKSPSVPLFQSGKNEVHATSVLSWLGELT